MLNEINSPKIIEQFQLQAPEGEIDTNVSLLNTQLYMQPLRNYPVEMDFII